jgi:hypothetical protein
MQVNRVNPVFQELESCIFRVGVDNVKLSVNDRPYSARGL